MNKEDQTFRVYNQRPVDGGEPTLPGSGCAKFKPADLRSPNGVWIDGRKYTGENPPPNSVETLTGGRPIHLPESNPGEEGNPIGRAAHHSAPADFLKSLFGFKRARR